MSSTYEGRYWLLVIAVATDISTNFEVHLKSLSKYTRYWAYIQNLFRSRQVKESVTISFMDLQVYVELI
jgi:hypothetical protein